MKKIIALLLCVTMVFSLMACTGVKGDPNGGGSNSTDASGSSTDNSSTDAPKPESSNSDASSVDSSDTNNSSSDSSALPPSSTDSSNTDNSSTSGSSVTSSSTGGSTRPDRPSIVPDRTNYVNTVLGDKEWIEYINEVARHPYLTPYYNGYTAALTMTFDDGYDSNTGTIVSDEFEKYGYRGTMMLGPCFLGGENIINEWNSILSRGYLDVGCHGYNHKEPTTLDPSEYEHEIKDAIMFLREKFPGQRVLTFATPYAHINSAYEAFMSDYVIGNRLEAGGDRINFGEDLSYNPYRVKAVSFNANTGASNAKTEVQNAVKYGRWVVELFHCVKDNATGVDVERSTFVSHCEWLYRNYRNDLWVATFEEVLIYGEQLKHTVVDYTACDRESLTFTVTPDGTLDYEIYNIPMSMHVYLPEFVDSAYAIVNGEYQPLEMEVIFETAEKYVTIRNIDATKQSDVVVYIGGNKTMKNNCVHRYANGEVVEPTHETGGYSVKECTKCGHTYKFAFTNPVHDYTGEEVVVIAPTERKNGFSKHYCTQCDKYIVEENQFIAPATE